MQDVSSKLDTLQLYYVGTVNIKVSSTYYCPGSKGVDPSQMIGPKAHWIGYVHR